MTRTQPEKASTALLKTLQSLPFARKISFSPSKQNKGAGVDGVLAIGAGKDQFTLAVVQKRSFLDRASLHAVIAMAERARRPLLLLARYVPRPSGEQLMAAGVNFVDEAGNVHLALGKKYAHTVLGRRQDRVPT